jgi:glycerol-3-phosphate cytidylyltransferase
MKRVLVDMSAALIHHGHIRLLKKAKSLGHVVVGLTTDKELAQKKGITPELNFLERKEILESIRYVDEVIPAPWLIDQSFLDQNAIDFLVHGSDNQNNICSEKLITFPRTTGVSTTELRVRIAANVESNHDGQ